MALTTTNRHWKISRTKSAWRLRRVTATSNTNGRPQQDDGYKQHRRDPPFLYTANTPTKACRSRRTRWRLKATPRRRTRWRLQATPRRKTRWWLPATLRRQTRWRLQATPRRQTRWRLEVTPRRANHTRTRDEIWKMEDVFGRARREKALKSLHPSKTGQTA